jgi:SAM-dependent methyltransferase
MRDYHSESDKVRDMPQVMKYITGEIIDFACGHDKIVPHAIGVDGRKLDGVDILSEHAADYAIQGDLLLYYQDEGKIPLFDTLFSSHFLEHVDDQYQAIEVWRSLLKEGGHLVLYLPDGNHYNNKENYEHMIDMKYEDFMFWFRRSWCGEGKNFKGENLPKYFEIVDHGLDVGKDRYSFYLICKKT